MADSFVQLNNDGPGKKIDTRTESTNGDHRQVMVIGDPTTNDNVANVTAAGGVQVDGSGVTQPISAVSLPLPTGAATSSNQSATQSTLASILSNTPPSGQAVMASSSPVVIASNQSSIPVTISGTTPVSGTVTANQGTANTLANGWPVELSDGTNLLGVTAHPVRIDPTGTTPQPISGTVTANAGTGTMNVSVQNASIPVTQSGTWTVQPGNTANTTPWLSTINQGGNSAAVTVSNALKVDGSAVTQPVSGTVTANAGTGSFTVAQATASNLNATVVGTVTANQGTANATPWNYNLAQVSGTAVSTAAAGVQKVGITGNTSATLDGVVTAATAPANGLAILTVAQTTPPSLTAGQAVAVQCDYTGSTFVKPYRRSQVTSKATTIAASTTATTVLPAQAAGIFADITALYISVTPAASATAFTCTLSDGTNSYIFDVMTGLTTTATPGLGVGAIFNPPLSATNAATAWTVANSSATPTVHITIVASLQKAS